MDKIYKICFSPTGGTERVAAILAKALASETVSVDLTARDVDFGSVTLGKDDVAMIAVPSYSGRVPAVAAARLAEMHGNGARAILVCVYGNRAYEDTLVMTKRCCAISQSGFAVRSIMETRANRRSRVIAHIARLLAQVSCPRLRVHASSAAFVRRNVPSAPLMRRIRAVSTRSYVSPACGALRYVHTGPEASIG